MKHDMEPRGSCAKDSRKHGPFVENIVISKRHMYVHEDVSCSCGTTRSRYHMSILTILLLYFLHLLNMCSSKSVPFDSSENITESALRMTSSSLLEWTVYNNSTTGPNDVLNQNDQSDEQESHDVTIANNAVNDVVLRFNIDSDQTTSYNSKEADGDQHVTTTPILSPRTYSRRPIYIRGHLLHHPSPDKRIFNPVKASSGALRAPNSNSSPEDFRVEPDGTNSRQKRKHSTSRDRVHNYKMLFHSSKGADATHKRTEFYAWIFGASMLGLGSLTTVTSCFVFCFCSDKVRKKKRKTQVRRSDDKAGEYQRVESVSSIVDHAGAHSEHYEDREHSELYVEGEQSELYDEHEHSELYDDPIDGVTSI